MTVCLLIMPEKLEEITVKVIKAPYLVSNEVYCDVRIWGDSNRNNIFRMKIGKTLWHSLHEELVMRFELGGDAGEEIDSDLECIVRKVITIRGYPDINRAYIDKKGKANSPKIFHVQLREDLEEAELEGGDTYLNAVKREIDRNRSCHKTITANMNKISQS